MLIESLLCMVCVQTVLSGSVTLTIPQGTLHGIQEKDYYGRPMTNFYGIPFAKPPVGNLRFSAPQPPDPWVGELDATTQPPACFQYNFVSGTVTGSENCLFLNIFTNGIPGPNSTAPLKPVMLYIPGGGFINGSSARLGGGFLVPENIVLVIIQYRLGSLGFLSIQNSNARLPGNAGLKDQVMSFRWVQKNIQYFGGDPNCVTIFGHSAGAGSVQLHVLSPMSKGLFHRAIASSGSAFNSFASPQDREERFVRLSSIVGCGIRDEVAMLACLRTMPPQEVLRGENEIVSINEMYIGQLSVFGVVVEYPSDEEAFLQEPISQIVTKGSFNKVPFLTGYTIQEGFLALVLPLFLSTTFTNVQRLVPYNTRVLRETSLSTLVGQKIKRLYYGNLPPSSLTVNNYVDLMTDQLILQEQYRAVLRQVAVSNSPVYFYEFSYSTSLNQVPSIVTHGDDAYYIFVTPRTPAGLLPGSNETIGIYRMVKLWTNFAKTGDPNPPRFDVRWKPVTNKTFNYLKIRPNLKLGVNPEARRMNFWDQLYQKLCVSDQ